MNREYTLYFLVNISCFKEVTGVFKQRKQQTINSINSKAGTCINKILWDIYLRVPYSGTIL